MNLNEALSILEIDDSLSLKSLKKIYRNRVKSAHPDITSDFDHILQINNAYQFLRDYLENYEFSVEKLLNYEALEERTFNRFKNDWLGGDFNG